MQELFVLRGGGGKKRGITTTAILLFTQCHIYPAGVIVRNYINLNGGTIFHQPNVFTGYYFFSLFFLLRVALLKHSHHFSEHAGVREKKEKKTNCELSPRLQRGAKRRHRRRRRRCWLRKRAPAIKQAAAQRRSARLQPAMGRFRAQRPQSYRRQFASGVSDDFFFFSHFWK